MSVRYQAEATRVYDAPRELLWELVGDSNRINRIISVPPAKYTGFAPDDAGQLARTAHSSELGVPMTWIEPPYEWVEGRRLSTRRVYRSGPVEESGVFARLEDAPEGGTRVTVGAWFTMSSPLRFVIGPFKTVTFRSALTRFLRVLAQTLEETRKANDPLSLDALRGASSDPMIRGTCTEASSLLERRAAVLRGSGVDAEVIERLIEHVRDRSDDEVAQMRPFELAHRWGKDRREVLRAFLHATVAGITDLRWQINCPVCRAGASVVAELAAIEEKSHCAACQIHYDTDFAQHVEAVFPCNEAVRPVSSAVYCLSSPAFLPHVIAQLRVTPSAPIEEPIDLPGAVHLRVLGRRGSIDLDLPRTPAALEVRIGETIAITEGSEAERGVAITGGSSPPGMIEASVRAEGERSVLRASVEGDGAQVLLVERSGWDANAVLGSVIASFPEFLDLFSTEAPASGVELSVGHLALLFSDLVGSTALYQRVGDARAFAIVEEHFRVSGEAIGRCGGAVIKTMGDAVMASFPSLREAMQAARAMVAEHEDATRQHDLGVKLGVHAGPCLAVRANDRLDYFGTTVNLAARLQAQARSGEIVITRESAEDPAIAPLLSGLPVRRFEASLKGIDARQELMGFDCRAVAIEAA